MGSPQLMRSPKFLGTSLKGVAKAHGVAVAIGIGEAIGIGVAKAHGAAAAPLFKALPSRSAVDDHEALQGGRGRGRHATASPRRSNVTTCLHRCAPMEGQDASHSGSARGRRLSRTVPKVGRGSVPLAGVDTSDGSTIARRWTAGKAEGKKEKGGRPKTRGRFNPSFY